MNWVLGLKSYQLQECMYFPLVLYRLKKKELLNMILLEKKNTL